MRYFRPVTGVIENIIRRDMTWLRRRLRASEAWFIALAIVVGTAAGLLTVIQGAIARTFQHLAFKLPAGTHLSAVPSLSPYQLLMLPLGGLLLGLFGLAVSVRKRSLVDAVEANALHGGRMSFPDSLAISGQTLISNGFGASVGLEAAYAQIGAGIASVAGQRLRLRRSDLRTLVGAGAGAAIAAAFGAPLTGAFYAFEIVIGAYTPSAIAPVAAAALAAALVARGLGSPSYLIALSGSASTHASDYLLYAILGAICAVVGIVLMRLVSGMETVVRRVPVTPWLRPAIGGLLLMCIAIVSPQVVSSGHGALHLNLIMGASFGLLASVFLLKCCASIVSLGFGFRGGLFFASLFLGSLLGHMFGLGLAHFTMHSSINTVDAALVGMAALAVAVVGGPMTMSMLVLEATHDFALTGAVIAAALISSTIVRDRFGYSFSTWRLHLRGETIKSARDVGWVKTLTAGRMMRRVEPISALLTVAEFRKHFPLGSTSRVVLSDPDDCYAGIANLNAVYGDDVPTTALMGDVASRKDAALTPGMDILAVMRRFDEAECDELAVLSPDRQILGLLSETHVRRRYAEELEKTQRELFGEI